MVKKRIVAAFAAIFLTAMFSYIFYIKDNTSSDALEEVDFSTMNETDIEIMAGVKDRMSATASSMPVTEQK